MRHDYNFTVTNLPGTQYHRASTVRLENPRGPNKNVSYDIEEITNTAGGTFVSTYGGNMSLPLHLEDEDFRAEVVNLVGLEGEEYGTKTAGEMMDTIMLYLNSHMIHETNKAEAKHEELMQAEQERIAAEEAALAEAEAQRKLEEMANANTLIQQHQSEIERLQALLAGDEPTDPVEEEPEEEPETPPAE